MTRAITNVHSKKSYKLVVYPTNKSGFSVTPYENFEETGETRCNLILKTY